MAVVLLLIFLVWRIVRLCCVCCCRWCCVTPSPFPDEVLGSTRLILLKIRITLLSLGVAASCAYGMSKVDPKLVDSGLGVINSTKAFMKSVFDQAYGVLGDISSVNGLLDQVQTILDVDVDVPSISANITCVALSIGSLTPGPALGYLNSIQNEEDGVLQPSIAALPSNLSTLLGSEVPAFQSSATVVTASPPFLSNYSSETDNFITAVNDLPASFPTGGSTSSYVLALGVWELQVLGQEQRHRTGNAAHTQLPTCDAALTGPDPDCRPLSLVLVAVPATVGGSKSAGAGCQVSRASSTISGATCVATWLHGSTQHGAAACSLLATAPAACHGAGAARSRSAAQMHAQLFQAPQALSTFPWHLGE
ncbi:g3400 [Coccomyxa elongata]